MDRLIALRTMSITAAALLTAIGATPLEAQTLPEASAIIVLDGSGSMWGRVNRDVKAYMARDAIKQSLPKVPGLKIGLASFGHRRQGDCNDVEVVFSPAKGDQSRMSGFLDKFNPKGRGPLTAALKAAAQSFEAGKDRPTIILMADNADNCRADACAEARELKTAMPQLTIHAIALGVPGDEIGQIACIASNTGGRLFQPESTKDASAALDEALRLALATVPAPPAPRVAVPQQPKPTLPAPTPVLAHGLRLVAVLKAGGQPITGGVRWRVTRADAADTALYEGEDAVPALEAKPGKYAVTARFGLVEARQVVEVTDKPAPPVEIVLNAGIINVKTPSARNPSATEKLLVTLQAASLRAGERPVALALSLDSAPVYQVPPGRYHVLAKLGLARVEKSVEIAAGTVVDLELPLYVGDLQLAATLAEDGPPAERVFFIVSEDDPDAPGGLREVVRTGSSAPLFALPAGNYYVVARMDGIEVRERVTVRAGARMQRSIALSAGQLALSLKPPGNVALNPELISFRVQRLAASATQPAEEVVRTSLPAPTLQLAAGRYRIEARYGTANARLQREIEIRPGGAHRIEFESDAAQVRLMLAEGAGGRTIADVFWEIRDRSGKTVWQTGLSAPLVVLAAGRYTAIGEHGGRQYEAVFDVRPGEDKVLEVSAK